MAYKSREMVEPEKRCLMENDIILGKSGYKWIKVEYIIYLGEKREWYQIDIKKISFGDNVLFFF